MATTAKVDKPDRSALDAFKDLLICSTCGTQFPTSDRTSVKTCFICDDPRQFVPPSGQSFTDLATIQPHHRNEFVAYDHDPRLTFIHPEPRLGIGQRAILIRTPRGNVLWDCVSLLDDETISRIEQLGGLRAIVISHPHFYGGHAMWASVFGCPVYVASEDEGWAAMRECPHRRPVTEPAQDILDTGIKAIKLGGHFPGSMVALFDSRLFIADTLMTVPAGLGDWSADALGEARRDEGQGQGQAAAGRNTFSFLWSIPNMIPLSADEMGRMWDALKGYEFRSTHGGFMGMDIVDERIKGRVLQSMQIQCERMGWAGHALMSVRVGDAGTS